MSRRFGDIRQIAFVIPHIEQSMRYWSGTLGVGPFFIQRSLMLKDFLYYGKASTSPTISIALANSGALQIELIQQHDDQPSIYRDFLLRGGAGLQHVSAWVSCTQFDRLTSELTARGVRLAQAGTIPSSGVRLAYFATEHGPGSLIYEVSDLADAQYEPRVQKIAAAARAWDGADPIREL